MVKIAVVSSLIAAAEAGTLAVTWSDCGAKHAKVTDLQPSSINTGATETLTGSGLVDEDVTAAKFTATVKAAGATLSTCSGDGTADIECKLPLGAGSITVQALTFPIKKGTVKIPVIVKTSKLIPPSLAKVDVHIAATDQNGEDVVCLDVHTAKGSFDDIVEQVNNGENSWVAQTPSRFGSPEDVMPFLGAFLPSDAEYTEPDVAEIPAMNSALPASFDSAANWPKCSVIGNVRDQSSCGSCWAFGSTCSFESRACISTGKDIKYSPEDTAFCSDAGNGCQGGNSAWNYFERTGVVTGGDFTDIGSEGTCYPYSLAPCAHHVPATAKYPACPSSEYDSPRCKNSCTESSYGKSFKADKVKASKAYSVRGETQIMTELTTNGPMYVAFSVYSDFPTYKSGVYTKTSGSSFLGGHAVTLVGYGVENGEKYWKIKNSWNEEWGNGGHFLIKRGTNECGIESSVSAGTVSATTVV
jgi:cathepsin B